MEDGESESVRLGASDRVTDSGHLPAVTSSRWRWRRGWALVGMILLAVALVVASCSPSSPPPPTGRVPIGHSGSAKPTATMNGAATPSGAETPSSTPIAWTSTPSAAPSSSSPATRPATARPTPPLTPWPSAATSPAPSRAPIPTPSPQLPTPTPTPHPQVAPLVDVSMTTCATGDSQPTEPYCSVPGSATTRSWAVTPVQLPWTSSETTSEGYLAAVELNSSPYWQDLTFCYSVMPEDDGSLDGMGGDGCSVGPSSGGSFGGSPTPPSETPPTVVVWVWTCTGTDLATCQAYGASQGWILPGNF